MNHGPLLFLAAFASISLSWFGFVFAPFWQLGGEQPVESVETGQLYPSPRAGLAQQGAEVYRANGCYYCHSQQVIQDTSDYDLTLTAVGPNLGAVGRILQEVRPDLTREFALNAIGKLPMEVKVMGHELTDYFTNKLIQAGAVIRVALLPPATNAPSAEIFAVTLTSAGKTPADVAALMLRLRPSLGTGVSVPVVLARGMAKDDVDAISKKLTVAGAKTQVKMNLRGADMDRGWGKRRSVSLDYLYDKTVMTGSHRLGPDLSNIGERQHSRVWHLTHLYDPRRLTSEESVAGVDSLMPAYPYLFTKRPRSAPHAVGHREALRSPGNDFELVPTPEAEALVAYLQSLESGAGLYEAPVPKTAPAPAPAGAKPAGPPSTNSAPTPVAPPVK